MDFNVAIGFTGILISGRYAIGGGSKDCGDFLTLPFDGGADKLFLTGGPEGNN